MSKERTPTREGSALQWNSLTADGLVDALWMDEREFPYSLLDEETSRAFGSFINSGNGSINQYVETHRGDLRLKPINFKHSSLRGIYLPGVMLPFTYFNGSDLTGAYFGDADLEEAKFVGATVENVEFSDAKLIRADLRNAKGLESCGFQNTRYDGALILPKQVELIRGIGLDLSKFRVEDFKRGEKQ